MLWQIIGVLATLGSIGLGFWLFLKSRDEKTRNQAFMEVENSAFKEHEKLEIKRKEKREEISEEVDGLIDAIPDDWDDWRRLQQKRGQGPGDSVD